MHMKEFCATATVVLTAFACLWYASHLRRGRLGARGEKAAAEKDQPTGRLVAQNLVMTKAEVATGRRCATQEPAAATHGGRATIAKTRPQVAAAISTAHLPIVVPVRFHIIHMGDDEKIGGKVSQSASTSSSMCSMRPTSLTSSSSRSRTSSTSK